MIVLVGLGNPGGKYARHRHNVGFMAVDAIADANGFGPARQKFQSEMREGFLEGPGGREKAIVLKPQTYMNESGRAVRKALDFYKLEPADFVVFYDELDLAPGKLRVKVGGGAAGHNGIRSIDSHVGNEFRRVRIGIGHPGDKSKVTGHVLGDFAKSDAEWLEPLLEAIAKAAPHLIADDQRFASDVAQQIAQVRTDKPTKVKAQSAPEKPKSEYEDVGATNPFTDAFRQIFGGRPRKDD
ncbi:MAG: aminoacyl-tRNA hydrolase [Marinicaulis sp.]|nr:aminoacyl-tRNA hydrolase [Marinicaulis sp.]NNL90261.1 aminoacyl-tRNA hydrolase [Marinicaulis sp.]